MKTKILLVIVCLGVSAALFAQPRERESQRPFRGERLEQRKGPEGPAQALNLTDEQKEAFKQSMLALQKQLQPLRNQLGEAEAHQRTLMTAEKPDLKDINKNIEKIGEIRVEMSKLQAKHRLEMRAQLNDEQRLKFDMFKHHQMKEGKGPKGMKHGPGKRE